MATKEKRTYGTGTIYYRLDKKRWVGGDRDANGKLHQVYGRTEADAKRKLKELQSKIARGELHANSHLKTGDYLERWLEGVKRRRAYQTYRGRRTAIKNHLLPRIGNIALARLAPGHVQEVIDAMQDAGAAPLHIAYIHQTIRAALTAAEREGLVTRNVAKLVELPRQDRAEVKPLTVEEAGKLLEAAQALRVGPIYTIALTLGLRVGEATGLRWQDVDLDERVARVRVQAQLEYGKWVLKDLKTRNGKRTIKLPALTVQALRQQRKRVVEDRLRAGDLWEDWDLVFPTPYGHPYNHRAVHRKLQLICELAGIEPTRVHELRHTCAALLRAQGVPLADVSAILGHSGIGITNDIYGHLYDDQRQQVADAMDRALCRKAR